MLKYCIKDDGIKSKYKQIEYEISGLTSNLSDYSYVEIELPSTCDIKKNEIVSLLTPNSSDYYDVSVDVESVTRYGYFKKNEKIPIYEISENIFNYDLLDISVNTINLINSTGGTVLYEKIPFVRVTKRYVILPNGNICYEQYNSESLHPYYKIEAFENGSYNLKYSNIGSGGTFDLNGFSYSEKMYDSTNYSAITLNTIYYNDNHNITYNGVDYSFEELSYYVNEDKINMEIIDDEFNTVKFENYNAYTNPYHMSKISISSLSNIDLNVKKVSRLGLYYYIIYNNKKYYFKFKDGKWVVDIYTTDTTYFTETYDNGTLNIDYDILNHGYDAYITINGVPYFIYMEYLPNQNGKYLSIQTDTNYDFTNNTRILIDVNSATKYDDLSYEVLKDLEGKYYFYYDGRKIYLEENSCKFTISSFITTQNNSSEEYDREISEVDAECNFNDYLKNQDNLIAYHIDEDGNETKWLVSASSTSESRRLCKKIGYVLSGDSLVSINDMITKRKYKLNAYRHAFVDGNEFVAQYSEGVMKATNNKYFLKGNVIHDRMSFKIDKVESANWIICSPIVDFTDYYSNNDLKNGDYVELLEDLNSQPYNIIYNKIIGNSNANYYIQNILLGDRNIPSVKDGQYNLFTEGFLELYKKINYISFPLHLFSKVENNLRQEEIVNEDFYEVEKEKSINRIVDMEKDIYYPVIQDDSGDFKNVYEIDFNLHFRTRDKDWKIIQQEFNEDGDEEETSELTDNWSIFDEYNRTSLSYEDIASGDLLRFLNFTENDVYYQKSRLAKTFIRLLFYDSPDETNQNLIHSSTVFFDENYCYKKYINNINSTSYRPYDKLGDANIQLYCNVNTEPVSDYGDINYKNDRLDMSFRIVNRSETDTSSEGFYIYMFKEYGYKLRPSSLYMKVEFNHAGQGKLISMMMPTKNKDGITCMVDDEESTEIQSLDKSELSDGIPLKDILKYQYIKLNTVYDEKTHRYVYYVPSTYSNGWNGNKITFNLWEIKIKDES